MFALKIESSLDARKVLKTSADPAYLMTSTTNRKKPCQK